MSLNYHSGKLMVGALSVSDISKKYETPFYLYDIEKMENQVKRLKSALQNKAHIHYAMKANSNLDILKAFKKLKVGVDVVSAGEIAIALKAGFKGSDIVFSGI